MKPVQILFCACFLFYLSPSLAQFSNMIVFGDSLSDSGNFPESKAIWKNPSAEKNINNTIAQFYVPFTNPVDISDKQFSVPMIKNTAFSWPILDNRYLAKQTSIENHQQMRQFRSISWPQFFLEVAFEKKLTQSQFLVPSNLIASRKIPSDFSFDYAWGYATSSAQCVNPFYLPNKTCTAKSITEAQKKYVNNPTEKNYQHIEIPGVAKQVELFIQDKNKNKVSVDKNTVYTFWIGGNDLIVASNALEQHYNPLPALEFSFGVTAWHTISAIHTLLSSLSENQKPKTIYVFNLFNPGLTPGYYQKTMGKIANIFVRIYDVWLYVEASVFNVFSDTKIKIVPVYKWYKNSSKNDYFKNTMGKACQLNNGDYTNPISIPKNNCDGFMFWNAVHPAMPMNVVVAHQFLLIARLL